MSAIFVSLKPCLLTLSVDYRRKCHKFIAAKQAIRDQSASFNQAKCIVGHINNPFQLKFVYIFHGHERNICLIEAMFD